MKLVPIMITMAAVLTAIPAAAQVPQPSAASTQAARQRGPCSDPWVTIALENVYGRVPSRLHCAIGLYANGRWNSYDQLVGEVRRNRYDFRGVPIGGNGPLAGKMALGIFLGGNLVAAGGGSMVAAGAGNMVAAGAGNMVAAGAGNMVAAGAGNLMQVGNSLVSPGSGYRLQGGTAVRVIN